MSSVIVPVLLGVIISMLGFSNIKGNISSIYWYHRKRVTEEDRIPFGKMMGLGTIIIGAGITAFGCLSFVTEKTKNDLFVLIGVIIVVIAIIVGLIMSFWAMIKYNKGIF